MASRARRLSAWGGVVLLLAAALAGAPGAARAAGHLDVDDADIPAPGHCQYEAWVGRAREDATTFQHLGPSCRVGPVQLGLNIDRSLGSERRATAAGPTLKWRWLGAPEDPLRMAVVVGSSWDTRQHGRSTQQLLLPLTWQALPTLALHLNLGLDWSREQATGPVTRTPRVGARAEWALGERLALMLERNRAQNAWTNRIGLRLGLAAQTSLDLSVARVRPGGAVLTVGLNQEFGN